MRFGDPIRNFGERSTETWNTAMSTLESELLKDWNNSQTAQHEVFMALKPAIHENWVLWAKRWLGWRDPVEEGNGET